LPGGCVAAGPLHAAGPTTEDAMGLRTYKDPDGAEWRVWRVVPDSISFATLGESYRDGWLCFERVDGSDRRRLSMTHAPTDWDDLADDRLDALCRTAEPAMRRSIATERIDTDPARRERPERRRD
jgi:hypothetical protein